MNKQQIIAKYAKHFAAKEGGRRPGLEGVHYADDGSVVVTNSHYMLRIRDAHKFENPITLHAKHGTPIEGEYPDTSRIFPHFFESTITLSRGAELDAALKSVKVMAAAANTINKKIPIVKLCGQNGTAHLWIKTDIVDLKAFFGNTPNLEPIDARTFNINYLLTALELFADSSVYPDVDVKFRVPHEPIVLTSGDIDVLILPYRVNQ